MSTLISRLLKNPSGVILRAAVVGHPEGRRPEGSFSPQEKSTARFFAALRMTAVRVFKQRVRKILSFFCTSILYVSAAYPADENRIPWVMDESYAGSYSDNYQKLRYEIPNILRQTVINLSVRIGLRYQEGWRYPLVVGFVDGAPFGVEHVLAYVQLLKTEEGGIKQELRINLKAYSQDKFDFEKVLAHELVHAMLNDSMGAEASTQLPLWFHEGLAVWGADQGEQMLKAYVYRFGASVDTVLLNGLENHASGIDYAEDYLAFKYIYRKHGINSLHNLVREVVKRRGEIPQALEYTCFESWDRFLKNLDDYARREIQDIGDFKGRPADMPRPY